MSRILAVLIVLSVYIPMPAQGQPTIDEINAQLDASFSSALAIQLSTPGVVGLQPTGSVISLVTGGGTISSMGVIYCERTENEERVIFPCGSGLYHFNYLANAPNQGNSGNDGPTNQCGSIIQADNLAVGESIPFIGTDLNLVYFSNRVKGRLNDYKIETETWLPSARPPGRAIVSHLICLT